MPKIPPSFNPPRLSTRVNPTLDDAVRRLGVGTPLDSKGTERLIPFHRAGEVSQVKFGHTEINTWFTRVSPTSQLFYSAEGWIRLRLLLETAGPVAVGTRQEINPVLSGKGRLLPIGQEVEYILPKGDRFYIVSESINRVSWCAEPIPWLDQINDGIQQLIRLIGSR